MISYVAQRAVQLQVLTVSFILITCTTEHILHANDNIGYRVGP